VGAAELVLRTEVVLRKGPAVLMVMAAAVSVAEGDVVVNREPVVGVVVAVGI
jgi:hypothetical protein